MALEADNQLNRLFAEVSRGELRALEEVFAQWERPLCNYAYSLVGNDEDAADAVAEAMLGLLKLGRGLRAVRNPRAYLFGAVRHAALRGLRQRHSSGPTEDADELARKPNPSQPDAAETLGVQEALMALPEEQREWLCSRCMAD